MRKKYELWTLVKKHFDEFFEFGICALLVKLRKNRIISLAEMDALYAELQKWGKENIDTDSEDYSFWPLGEKKNRLELIDTFIGKHKHQNTIRSRRCKALSRYYKWKNFKKTLHSLRIFRIVLRIYRRKGKDLKTFRYCIQRRKEDIKRYEQELNISSEYYNRRSRW